MIRISLDNRIGDSTVWCLSLLFYLLLFTSCDDGRRLSYDGVSKEYYEPFAVEGLKTNSGHIRDEIRSLCRSDKDSMDADYFTRSYYLRGGNLLWVNRYGVSRQADSLVAFLDTASLEGFRISKDQMQCLHENVERVRQLAFSDDEEDVINKSFAQLEYYLTKTFLRYGVGLRYGLTNPGHLLNNLDVKDSDSLHVTYRQLFDIRIHSAGRNTFSEALRKVSVDSLPTYLKEARPTDPLYYKLRAKLPESSGSERDLLLVNMERLRWHVSDAPYKHKEYIVVNIPAYHLWAVREGQKLDMRVGCGSRKTKTPLLTSAIERMDINPQWVIPGSITKKDIIRHAGNGAYFDSHHYFAQNRRTGEKLTGNSITWSVINSDDYYIIQKGGEGNSLGRIIFRFPNNFAVYLHDTSSRSFFARDDRSVSHGCVRVERPYDLACFLLRGKDEDKAEKIRYSMENDINSEDIDKSQLISCADVDPHMPLFIMYQTLFMTPEGTLETYPDVYGYDAVLLKRLKEY